MHLMRPLLLPIKVMITTGAHTASREEILALHGTNGTKAEGKYVIVQ